MTLLFLQSSYVAFIDMPNVFVQAIFAVGLVACQFSIIRKAARQKWRRSVVK
ncbi:hypothetical protein [Paenilisteria weihenstephanensis]|nr:hypothetical protein [Listeria weihenstephanensis]